MRKRPLVVFLDSYSWQAFTDLAGGLRQRGVQVARVTARTRSPRALFMRTIESWVYGRTHGLVDGGVLHGLPASISQSDLRSAVPSDAADVQMQEDLIAFGMADPDGPADISRRVRAGVDPNVLVDKWVQGEWAERAGVPTPRAWQEQVAEEFPVVVKTRVGFGGNGVRVVHDRAGLTQAWADLTGPDGQPPFLQECLTPSLHTGGVAVDGVTLINVAYDGRPAPDDPTGPPYTVFAVRDPAAIEATERFLASIGYTGFFCIDWVVDQAGTLRLIDFNSRVFGSWPALQELGFDFLSAYAHVVGAGPRPPSSVGRYDESTTTLRYPCPDVTSRAAVLRWRAETLAVVRRRRPLLGRRWALVIRVRTALGVVRALGKLAGQPRGECADGVRSFERPRGWRVADIVERGVTAQTGDEIVLQDPYHPYAVRFIELARDRGLRAVCLYTDAAEMARSIRKFPVLTGPTVSASYLVAGRDIEDVAAHLRSRHRVVAVVPHVEPTVLALGRLAELLELPWAQPGVLERFRDKHALKSYLRSVPDGPRINAIAAVRTFDDVQEALATGAFGRFVLKPNDGFGNTTIGYFDADGDEAPLRKYLHERGGAQLLMEEYIGGVEYFIDGQVDADRDVECFAVWKYTRRDVNGQEAVSMGDTAVPTTDPDFEAVVAYTAEIVRATGLRSSPFHLELKVDDTGPCLIEVGARLVGGDLAEFDPVMHRSLDMMAVALHYYLGGTEHVDSGLDWEHYDRHLLTTVNGMSTTYGRVYEIEGLDEIEARPDFIGWAWRPTIGSPLIPTVDLLHRPWRLVLLRPPDDEYDDVTAEVRATLRLNSTSTGAVRRWRRLAGLAPVVAARLDRMRRPPSFVVPLP